MLLALLTLMLGCSLSAPQLSYLYNGGRVGLNSEIPRVFPNPVP